MMAAIISDDYPTEQQDKKISHLVLNLPAKEDHQIVSGVSTPNAYSREPSLSPRCKKKKVTFETSTEIQSSIETNQVISPLYSPRSNNHTFLMPRSSGPLLQSTYSQDKKTDIETTKHRSSSVTVRPRSLKVTSDRVRVRARTLSMLSDSVDESSDSFCWEDSIDLDSYLPDGTHFRHDEQEISLTLDNDVQKRCAWNERFQRVLALSENNPHEALRKYNYLSSLSLDFISTVKTYGRTIIEEFYLSDEKKTILPDIRFGGVAGGRKYVVRGILFKVAEDKQVTHSNQTSSFLYGGTHPNQENAFKIGGHELKGSCSYFRFNSQYSDTVSFCVPMQATADYRGFRLVAMPLLPLKTLIYGSNDGGRTVHADDDRMNAVMQDAARYFHIAGHRVKGVTVHSAADCEGHEGYDGRHYLIDLARAFPPESPMICQHLPQQEQSVLYRLLRPELLLRLKQTGKVPPVSPDAYTAWGKDEAGFHAKNIDYATSMLIHEIVPELAEMLDNSSSERLLSLSMSEEFHRLGVNMRHLGLVRSYVQNVDGRTALLVEIVTRTIKGITRSAWRNETIKQSSVGNAYGSKFREIVVTILNLVCGSGVKAAPFWEHFVPREIERRFGKCTMTQFERPQVFALVNEYLDHIVFSLTETLGLQLTEMCQNAFRVHEERRLKYPAKKFAAFEFAPVDIYDMAVRVKFMSIISYAEGMALLESAQLSRSTNINNNGMSIRLASLALHRLEAALKADPLNERIGDACARAKVMVSQQHTRRKMSGLLSHIFVNARLKMMASHHTDSSSNTADAKPHKYDKQTDILRSISRKKSHDDGDIYKIYDDCDDNNRNQWLRF